MEDYSEDIIDIKNEVLVELEDLKERLAQDDNISDSDYLD